MAETIQNNPLLQKFDEAPFSNIETGHFKPAILAAIEQARAEIETIANNENPPTFSNTIEALDASGYQLSRVTSVFFNLNSAETNDAIQQIAQEVSPQLAAFRNDITLNQKLFQRIKAVYEQSNTLELTPEQSTLLEKNYKSFSRNGANLSPADKEKLRAIDSELSQLTLKFGENVLAETNAFEMHLTKEEDVDGLPEGAKTAAAQLAKSKGKEGWVITLQYPSYIPFMKYAKNRDLRKKLSLAFGSKAFKNNDFDNQANVLRIANLRHQRANLLGYTTHAHFVLEERMAESPQKVNAFLQELLDKAKPAAEKEFEQLKDFAERTDGITDLQKWDSAYYAEKLKQELFELR